MAQELRAPQQTTSPNPRDAEQLVQPTTAFKNLPTS